MSSTVHPIIYVACPVTNQIFGKLDKANITHYSIKYSTMHQILQLYSSLRLHSEHKMSCCFAYSITIRRRMFDVIHILLSGALERSKTEVHDSEGHLT